jgi:hypothetical protein
VKKNEKAYSMKTISPPLEKADLIAAGQFRDTTERSEALDFFGTNYM